ncbi:olfactory receptor 4L1-like [Gastrophryne carolinensis]
MENVSSVSFILLGLVDMERFRFIYAILALLLYLSIIVICCLILYVVWTEETLHEPMYIFICNLVFNGMFGSSAFLPKLIIALLSGAKSIWFSSCLIQSFCIHSFAAVELFNFAIMAQDRYLAIGQPLRYHAIMNNKKVVRYIIFNWVVAFVMVLIPVVMTAYLTMCGLNINNVFCDNTSLIMLACGDATVNNIFGAVEAFLINFVCLLIIIYYYLRTFLICLETSKEAFQKAARTLVTHLAAFSTFMVSTLFVLLRYRINGGSLSLQSHVLISVIGFIIPITVNPLIYGLRTEALRLKISQKLQKCKVCQIC